MKRKIFLVVLCLFCFSSIASAHVMNKNNSFNDLALSKNADDIVLLSALGIISNLDDSYDYLPTQPLTAKDLAAWVANYHGEKATSSDELATIALKNNWISTIDGEATYQLVNDVYFHGALTLQSPDATMTRDEFVAFVVRNVQADIGGHTLLDMANYTQGPTGTIEAVERVKKQKQDGKTAYIYVVTVDGQSYELGMHPRTISESADPSVWIGQQLAQSFYGPNAESDQIMRHNHATTSEPSQDADSTIVATTALQFLVIGNEPFIKLVEQEKTEDTHEHHITTQDNDQQPDLEQAVSNIAVPAPALEEAEEEQQTSISMMNISVVIVVVVLFAILFYLVKGRNKNNLSNQ